MVKLEQFQKVQKESGKGETRKMSEPKKCPNGCGLYLYACKGVDYCIICGYKDFQFKEVKEK